MKRYNNINFIKDDINEKYPPLIICLVILLLITVGVYAKFILSKNNTYKINQITEHEVLESINNDINSMKYIKFQDIKIIYKIIGKENIKRLLSEENNIEVEGTCKDLSTLEKLKNESDSKEFSIESIIKENDNYVFKLKYSIGV